MLESGSLSNILRYKWLNLKKFSFRIKSLVAKLPDINRRVLSALMKHLSKVEQEHEKNKMTVQNLGVCFGPTLLRDKEVKIVLY